MIKIPLATAFSAFWILTFSTAQAQTAQEVEQLRLGYAALIVSSATFVEQCHARGIVDAQNVQNETIEMGQALNIVRPNTLMDHISRGANGEIFDLARNAWIKLPFREDHCKMVLGEQQKIKISLSKQF